MMFMFNHCDVLFKPTLAKHVDLDQQKKNLNPVLGQNKVCDKQRFAIKSGNR